MSTSPDSGKKTKERFPATNSAKVRIGFIGAGRIAESIINGLVMHGKVDPKRIFVSAPTNINSDRLKQTYQGLSTSRDNMHIFSKASCDITFIAVHGSVFRNLFKIGGSRPRALCGNYLKRMRKTVYVLSLVTGIDLKSIKDCLFNPDYKPGAYSMMQFHRIVLNCASTFGLGVGYVDVEPDSGNLGESVRTILTMVAKLEYLPQSQMDAACAVCGAGLAFSYYFINSMADGALKVGLNRVAAIKFVAKTVNSAMVSLFLSDKLPSELKDEVCAPSGGAIYGVSLLDKGEVASSVSAAVEAAHARAISLAKDDVK